MQQVFFVIVACELIVDNIMLATFKTDKRCPMVEGKLSLESRPSNDSNFGLSECLVEIW